MEVENAEEQVQVQLKTKHAEYAVPDVPYTIPSTVTTNELNSFVNKLLSELTVRPAFDFLVLDEFLRGRLCDHLRDRGVSFEDTIDIEFVERFPSPEPQDCLLHDDWVSALHTCGKWVLTGSYDNTVNIWTVKGKHKITIPGHTMPVKAVSWLKLDEERGTFISCGMDQLVMVWEWQIAANTVECLAVGKGHERGIHAVGVSADKERFATGSWDTYLKIWNSETNNEPSSSKRTKQEGGAVKLPKMTLQGHRECVSAVQWLTNSTLLTASWDHTMKIWDLELEGVKQDIFTNKSIFDASYSPLNQLIVVASADKNIRLFDARSNQGSVVRNTYLGHQQWVQAVMWSPVEEHLFVSGSYDNQTKLWDCRSPKAPLYDLIGHSDKIMDIDWSNPKYIVSGGADNTVRVYRSRKAGYESQSVHAEHIAA